MAVNTGVMPIGQVEPFNEIQRSAILRLAGGAPALGFMSGAANSYQNAVASAPSSAVIRDLFGAGTDLLKRGTQTLDDETFTKGIERFMNPYTQQVVDSTLRRINEQGDVLRSNITGGRAGSRSFGDTSQGVQYGMLDKNLLSEVADTTGELNYRGFNDATGSFLNQFNQDRGRELTGAGIGINSGFQGVRTLQDLVSTGIAGNQANQQNFATNTGNRLNAGTIIQNQNQRILDALRPDLVGARDYPVTSVAQLGQLLGAFPGSSTGGSAGSPDLLSKLGGAGLVLGSQYGSGSTLDISKLFG